MTGQSPDQLLLQGVLEVMLLSPDPHHQLLLQLLQETIILKPYAASLLTYSVYPFPYILLIEPPPVWAPMPPAPIGYRGGKTRPPMLRPKDLKVQLARMSVEWQHVFYPSVVKGDTNG